MDNPSFKDEHTCRYVAAKLFELCHDNDDVPDEFQNASEEYFFEAIYGGPHIEKAFDCSYGWVYKMAFGFLADCRRDHSKLCKMLAPHKLRIGDITSYGAVKEVDLEANQYFFGNGKWVDYKLAEAAI